MEIMLGNKKRQSRRPRVQPGGTTEILFILVDFKTNNRNIKSKERQFKFFSQLGSNSAISIQGKAWINLETIN